MHLLIFLYTSLNCKWQLHNVLRLSYLHNGWFPRFESNKYFAIKVNQSFLIQPLKHAQGCQNIHKNILQMNLMSYDLKIKPKVKELQKNLKNVQKKTVFLVVWLRQNHSLILISLMLSVTSVVEFCRRETWDFSKKITKRKIFFDLTFTDVHRGRQKVPQSDFQSQFSMWKIIRIFLIFF